jgi:putative nucleotidyltransferase with HDIG domain
MKTGVPAKARSGRSGRAHLEWVLVASVILGVFVIEVLVPYKTIVRNFFFIPTVIASSCLGMRAGGLTALLAFSAIAIDAILNPMGFYHFDKPLLFTLDLCIWGACLGLTALVVGGLKHRLQENRRDLETAYGGVLEILTKYLESADSFTKSHSIRVADLSTAIATQMGLTIQEIENIRAGALLHDIGKTDAIDLVKRASGLTESERTKVASHTHVGASLVKSVGTILQDAVPIILYHHHNFAGPENPDGVTGMRIPLGARIVAVADAYDAIVTDRPYRKGKAPWQALSELEVCSGAQFDPEVIQAFKRILPRDSIEPERDLSELQPPHRMGKGQRDPASRTPAYRPKEI